MADTISPRLNRLPFRAGRKPTLARGNEHADRQQTPRVPAPVGKDATKNPVPHPMRSLVDRQPIGRILALALTLSPTLLHAQLPAGDWQYFWGDDFSGTTYDGSKWQVGPSWGMSTASPTAVDASKVHVADGVLTLEATRVKVNGSNNAGDEIFAGGMLSTYQRKNFNGGYIEARIWLPDTVGSWPAFWGLYDGWPPEMDIMEYPLGAYANTEYHTAFHYVNTSGSNASGAGKVNPSNAGDLRGGWHTFAVNWVDDTSVRFYFDGQQVSSFTNGAEVAEMVSMYLILNYAVGGWPAVPSTTDWPVGFTDEMKVDWVRVWKSESAKTSDWVNAGASEYMSWDTAGNWTNGVPNLGGVTSNFGTVTPAAQRIDWSGSRMLSVINLSGGTRYRFGWPDDRLILGYGNGGAIQPAINLAAGTTSEQEVYGELEWSGPLAINNDSPQPLLLTGRVLGGDGILINGPGVVSFDGNDNTYSGTTVIDSGSQGPGIARARGQNSLGSGLVVIGEQGNATTARLELENDSLVPNAIILNGRNNDSAGIVNNSGTNTITGTISSQTGGDRYWIQSNAGELILSGADGGGTAINSGAGSTRTFTVKGAGDGTVAGRIENGNAATLNLVKADAGTWTLQEANTYTGTTTVNGGTLVVDGTTGTGATTLASGSTLGGGGLVNSSLTANSGSTVRAGAVGFPLVSPSPFTLLDDFDSYNNSTDTKTTVATGGVWSAEFIGTANSNIVDSDQGQSLQTLGGAAWRGAERDLTGTDAAVLVGETKTYFWQVKATSTGGAYDFMMGLSQSVANIDSVNAYQDFNVMPFINNGATTPYINAEAPTTPWWAAMSTGVWYNVWVVVDNDATTPTYDLYYSTGAGAPVLVAANANWRNTGAMPVGNALNAIGFMAAGGVGSTLLVDNIYYAPGEELQNPLDFIGAPLVPSAGTLNVGGNLTLNTGATAEFDVSTGPLHDKLVVGGSFNAFGTLKVTLDPAQPEPVAGDSFDLFDNSGGTIAFSSYDLPALAAGLAWDTSAISTGVVSVVTDHTQYAGWALDQPFAPGEDGPDFDVEPDGLDNAFEWLLGGNAFVSDTEKLPQGQRQTVAGTEWPGADPAKHYLSLTATIRKNLSGWTLAAQAASSPDLLDAPGSSDNIYTRQLNDMGDFEEREWIYKLPMDDEATGFMRLKLTED